MSIFSRPTSKPVEIDLSALLSSTDALLASSKL